MRIDTKYQHSCELNYLNANTEIIRAYLGLVAKFHPTLPLEIDCLSFVLCRLNNLPVGMPRVPEFMDATEAMFRDFGNKFGLNSTDLCRTCLQFLTRKTEEQVEVNRDREDPAYKT